ncbi:MAG: hypothetical protein L3J39_11255 [Verrucomicrobiales bacterium]|nr:hypothetical protein [Verrucomicrobiales bacterium]
MPYKIISLAAVILILLIGKISSSFFFIPQRANEENEKFDKCVKKWEKYVRSNYIMTAFSDKPILDPSYSGSWVAFQGSTAEALFAHPVMTESNPKHRLLHDLAELEPIFDRLHEIRLNSNLDAGLRDAAMQFGYFKPIFNSKKNKEKE